MHTQTHTAPQMHAQDEDGGLLEALPRKMSKGEREAESQQRAAFGIRSPDQFPRRYGEQRCQIGTGIAEVC